MTIEEASYTLKASLSEDPNVLGVSYVKGRTPHLTIYVKEIDSEDLPTTSNGFPCRQQPMNF